MSTHRQTDDLAAMLARAARLIGDAEEPLLAERGLTMWDYVVLSRLARGSAPNQLALARDVRHDKSRLIPLLDALETRGLVRRDRDPSDRRSHTVSITDTGRRAQRSAQTAIRAMERDVLAVLTAAERRTLLAVLPKLNSAE